MTSSITRLLDCTSNGPFDLLDDQGRVLLMNATECAANQVADRLSSIAGSSGSYRLRIQGAEKRTGMFWDWRHEGPLDLLAYSSDFTVSAGVLVRSHVGRCGLELEEAARRLDQFTEQHRAVLLAVMAEHFGFDLAEWQTYLHGETA